MPFFRCFPLKMFNRLQTKWELHTHFILFRFAYIIFAFFFVLMDQNKVHGAKLQREKWCMHIDCTLPHITNEGISLEHSNLYAPFFSALLFSFFLLFFVLFPFSLQFKNWFSNWDVYCSLFFVALILVII